MKTSVFFFIAFRIILLFGTGMLMSYINPSLREFLGDEKFVPFKNSYGIAKYEDGCIDVKYIWHAPHYWYHICCIFIFILSLINTIISIVLFVSKKYNVNWKEWWDL